MAVVFCVEISITGNAMKTLVVIDMQPEFSTAEKIIPNVIKQIRDAKRNGHHIILVEYVPYGDTHREILDAIGDYIHFCKVTKSNDDGGKAVVRKAKSRKIALEDLVFCGVNVSWCVAATIGTMQRLLPQAKFSLVKKAANCNCSAKHRLENLQRFTQGPVAII